MLFFSLRKNVNRVTFFVSSYKIRYHYNTRNRKMQQKKSKKIQIFLLTSVDFSVKINIVTAYINEWESGRFLVKK